MHNYVPKRKNLSLSDAGSLVRFSRTHFSLKQCNPSTLIVNKTMVANFANSKRSSQFSMRRDPCDFLDSAQSYMYLSSDSAQLCLSRTALSLTKVFRSVHGSGQHGVRQCCPTRVLPATQQSTVSMYSRQYCTTYCVCVNCENFCEGGTIQPKKGQMR